MYTDIDTLDLTAQPDEGDTLVWLRKHRDEIAEKYPTVAALSEYLKLFNSVEDALARVRAKIAEENALAAAS